MAGKGKQADSKRKEELFDLEQQFILRMPPGQAIALTHELENAGNLRDNLFIEINPEHRWGHVRYGGELINAKLVDLPCTIETLKTTDNKTFYKTADICQMVICSNDMEPSDDESESPKKKKEKEKKYQSLHGIVPPLKNVRRRRFRKTLRKKPIDLASIEKEVKRLLRMDLEAIKTEITVVDDESAAEEGNGGEEVVKEETISADLQLDEEKLFGEISSSEEEGDINIDEDSDTEQVSADIAPLALPFTAGSDVDVAGGDEEEEEDVDAIVEKIGSLKQQLLAVETRISHQEMEIKQMDNPDLRRRFEAVLDELYAEKSDITAEIHQLENMG